MTHRLGADALPLARFLGVCGLSLWNGISAPLLSAGAATFAPFVRAVGLKVRLFVWLSPDAEGA